MAKFKVNVIIKAQVEYEVEVEASTEFEAEDLATGLWAEKTPDDFQVNKGYITDWEVDQTQRLTFVCEECGVEYPAEVVTVAPIATYSPKPLYPWKEDEAFCELCGAKIEAEDAAKAAAKAGTR